MSTRRSTNRKRAARDLAAKTGVTYQQALAQIIAATDGNTRPIYTGVEPFTYSKIVWADNDGEFELSGGAFGNPGCDDCGTLDATAKVDGVYLCEDALFERGVIVTRRPEGNHMCGYCDDTVHAIYGANASIVWVTPEGGQDCWDSPDSAHNVFDPAAGLDNGPCLDYVFDEKSGDIPCARCYHYPDEHDLSARLSCPGCGAREVAYKPLNGEDAKPYECGDCGLLFAVDDLGNPVTPIEGATDLCPSCDEPRPYPVTRHDLMLFLPGSVCPNCGDVAPDIEFETERWLTIMDGEGTIRVIDENGNTETVVALSDGDEWDAWAPNLGVDRELVEAAIIGLDD